jgi:hypothetical protein
LIGSGSFGGGMGVELEANGRVTNIVARRGAGFQSLVSLRAFLASRGETRAGVSPSR